MTSPLARAVHRSVTLGILIAGFISMPCAVSAASPCATSSAENSKVIRAVQELFDAMRTDNLERFREITAPNFYAYDAGMRFNGTELQDFVKSAHASGKRFEWSITEPQVHVACNVAWITYVNIGAVEDASGRQPISWLESAILEYTHSRWHIQFLHSSRMPKAN